MINYLHLIYALRHLHLFIYFLFCFRNMPPNAVSAPQAISESLINASSETNQNPKSLHEATTGVLFEYDAETIDGGLVKDIERLKKAEKRKLKLVWRNIIAFGYLHVAALYGAYLMFTSAKWQTMVFGKC